MFYSSSEKKKHPQGQKLDNSLICNPTQTYQAEEIKSKCANKSDSATFSQIISPLHF